MASNLPAYGSGMASTKDDAKRFHDAITLHRIVKAVGHDEVIAGRFIAVRLSDGGSDNTLYDTREDAIRCQSGDANRYLYFKLPLEIPDQRVCASLLGYARRRYDAGFRPAGVHEGRELILPTNIEDLLR